MQQRVVHLPSNIRIQLTALRAAADTERSADMLTPEMFDTAIAGQELFLRLTFSTANSWRG
jgi:hypothetical protein